MVVNIKNIILSLIFLLSLSCSAFAMDINIDSKLSKQEAYTYEQITQETTIKTSEYFTYKVNLLNADNFIYQINNKEVINKNGAYTAKFMVFLYAKNIGKQLLPIIDITLITNVKSYNLKNTPEEVNVIKQTINDDIPIADNIEILSGEQPSEGEVYIGEPIKRTIVIKALNLNAELIKPFNATIRQDGMDIKQYEGSSNNKTSYVEDGLYGIKSLTMFYIPRNKGELIFPELSYKWFNPNDKQIHISKTKELKYQVIEEEKTTLDYIDKIKTNIKSPDNIYRLCASLIFIIVIFISRYKRKHISKKQHINDVVSDMRTACNKYDAKQAENAIIQIGKIIYNIDSKDIMQIANLTKDDEFVASVSELSAYIYNNDGAGWNADEMFSLFKNICNNNQADNKIKKRYNPEELYPY